MFPCNTKRVSAIYIISVSKPLLQPLKLEVEHCANLKMVDQINCLKFVTAPYDLSEGFFFNFSFAEGQFTMSSQYGSFSDYYKDSCLLGIVVSYSLQADLNQLEDYHDQDQGDLQIHNHDEGNDMNGHDQLETVSSDNDDDDYSDTDTHGDQSEEGGNIHTSSTMSQSSIVGNCISSSI